MVSKKKGGLVGRINNNKTETAPKSRFSQIDLLLADDEGDGEDAIDNADNKLKQAVSNIIADTKNLLANLTIDFEEYYYPRERAVPEDCYYSTIAGMSAREKEGKVILDVDYDLEDRYGLIRHIRQSYPVGSQPYQKFCAAMVSAGINKGQPITDAVGTTELIRIGYVSKNSDLGSIVERKPHIIPPEDSDDEFDDFLEDEDAED